MEAGSASGLCASRRDQESAAVVEQWGLAYSAPTMNERD